MQRESLPGAKIVRQRPMLEKLAMLSLSVDAPTTMGVEALQGDMVQLSPPLLLPALHEQQYLVTNKPHCGSG